MKPERATDTGGQKEHFPGRAALIGVPAVLASIGLLIRSKNFLGVAALLSLPVAVFSAAGATAPLIVPGLLYYLSYRKLS